MTDPAPEPTVPEPAPLPPEASDEAPADILRRIRRNALIGYALFAAFLLISRGFPAFVGLTCSAAVTMISFLWLEEIVESLLQPAAHLQARKVMRRTLLRFVFLGVALIVTIFVARFDPLSVLLGFSIIVLGIIGEALYQTYRSIAA